MTVDKKFVNEMTVYKKSVDEMTAYKILQMK